MELLYLIFTGVAIGISGAMIPGPLTLFTIAETVKSNGFAGLKIIAGHIALEFILIWITLLGLHKFFSSESFLLSISVIGGLALIGMGILLIIKAPKMRIMDKGKGLEFNKGLFLGGAFFTIMSPGFIIWWATIGVSTLIKAFFFGITGVLLLTLGHWAADIGWYWSLSYAVDKGKRHLSDRAYQNIIRFFSVWLVVLGTHFLVIRLITYPTCYY